MIRLLALLATAAAVVWLAGSAVERGDEAVPALDLKHKVSELRDGLARVAASIPEVELAISDPVPAGGGDSMPAPRPDSGRALADDATVASPEPFVVDDEAPSAPQTAAAAPRSALDRKQTRAVRGRLDRVMTLATGSER